MSTTTLNSVVLALAASPTPLHGGSNGDPLGNPTTPGFAIRADGGDVYLGDKDVDASTGFLISDGETVSFEGFLSRGTYRDYQLTEVYYIGGPLKITIEKEFR